MPTPYDVPPSMLIERLTQYLKDNVDNVKPPSWAPFVKTGTHAQRPPENPDWWYVRCASLLPEHTRKGSGAIIRNALKQLEESGLVKTLPGRGRVVTPEGRRLLDLLSTEIKREIEKENPELKKY